MTQITLYHNPRCSKSRQALALLRDHGVEPVVRLYLEDPPSQAELREILRLLQLPAHAVVRRAESIYRELELDGNTGETVLVRHMAANPILVERPIAITTTRAVIGRPPEKVLELLA